MSRDRNMVCETCYYYCNGYCRYDPPDRDRVLRLGLEFPTFHTKFKDQVIESRTFGTGVMNIEVPGGWSKVADDDWCGKWKEICKV